MYGQSLESVMLTSTTENFTIPVSASGSCLLRVLAVGGGGSGYGGGGGSGYVQFETRLLEDGVTILSASVGGPPHSGVGWGGNLPQSLLMKTQSSKQMEEMRVGITMVVATMEVMVIVEEAPMEPMTEAEMEGMAKAQWQVMALARTSAPTF